MKTFAAVLLAVAMAGCLNQAPSLGALPDSCPSEEVLPLDASAHDAVAAFILPDGVERPRIPGREGHATGGCWLRNAATVDGWSVEVESFTGAEYQDLAHGAVASYSSRSSSLCTDNEHERVTNLQFHNILAHHDVPGTDVNVMLSAHWDSKREADDGGWVLGANDGASGVGVLLALQRVLAEVQPVVDLTVAFWDGEDGFEDCHPLAGSIFHARTSENLPDAMILLDMVGDDEARFARESRSHGGLESLIWQAGHANGLQDAFTNTSKRVLDDHVPFDEEGVPVVDIIDFARTGSNSKSGFPWYWHTSGDTLDKLDPTFMDTMVAVMRDVVTNDDLPRLLQ